MSSVRNRGRVLLLVISAAGALLIGSTAAIAAPVTGERALLGRGVDNERVSTRMSAQSPAAIDGERALLEPGPPPARRSKHERSGAVTGRAFDGAMALLSRPGH